MQKFEQPFLGVLDYNSNKDNLTFAKNRQYPFTSIISDIRIQLAPEKTIHLIPMFFYTCSKIEP